MRASARKSKKRTATRSPHPITIWFPTPKFSSNVAMVANAWHRLKGIKTVIGYDVKKTEGLDVQKYSRHLDYDVEKKMVTHVKGCDQTFLEEVKKSTVILLEQKSFWTTWTAPEKKETSSNDTHSTFQYRDLCDDNFGVDKDKGLILVFGSEDTGCKKIADWLSKHEYNFEGAFITQEINKPNKRNLIPSLPVSHTASFATALLCCRLEYDKVIYQNDRVGYHIWFPNKAGTKRDAGAAGSTSRFWYLKQKIVTSIGLGINKNIQFQKPTFNFFKFATRCNQGNTGSMDEKLDSLSDILEGGNVTVLILEISEFWEKNEEIKKMSIHDFRTSIIQPEATHTIENVIVVDCQSQDATKSFLKYLRNLVPQTKTKNNISSLNGFDIIGIDIGNYVIPNSHAVTYAMCNLLC